MTLHGVPLALPCGQHHLRRGREDGLDGVALFEQLGEHERLEGRAGLAPAAPAGRAEGQVDRGGGVVLAADQGLDRPVLSIDTRAPDGSPAAGLRASALLAVHGVVGLGLQGRVEGGGDPQPAPVDHLPRPYLAYELLAHGRDEVGVAGCAETLPLAADGEIT